MKLNYNLALRHDSYSIRHTSASRDGFLNFYIDSIGHFYAQKGYYTEREGLDTYLMLYTLGGYGRLNYGSESYILEKGSIAILQCSSHQYYCTQSDEWNFYYVHFYGKSADNYYSLSKTNGAFVISAADEIRIIELLNEIESRSADYGMIADIRIACAMENLFAEIMTAYFNPIQNSVSLIHKETIEQLQQYLKTHYSEPITVDIMAHMCSMSKYHFLRIFKQITGMTPHEYLKFCRISESKRLLTETEYQISHIADCVGYTDVNRYIQNFKQCVGMTPLQYRKHCI